MAPCSQHRPLVGVPEELVGDAPGMHEIFLVSADTTKNTEDRLYEERWPDQAPVKEVGQRVEVADIVALEFETHSMIFTKNLEDVLDIFERVAENKVSRVFQVAPLPVMTEVRDLVENGEEAEIHGSHVERRHFRTRSQRPGKAFVERHAVSSAG